MATPIKAVPILTGTLADDFVRQAEENERKPRRILSEEKEKKIAEIMRRSRESVPSWVKPIVGLTIPTIEKSLP